MTYNQYNTKEKLNVYKKHGLQQFKSLFDAHKNRSIPLDDLKWGEEMEYQVLSCSKKTGNIMMTTKGFELIDVFNNS